MILSKNWLGPSRKQAGQQCLKRDSVCRTKPGRAEDATINCWITYYFRSQALHSLTTCISHQLTQLKTPWPTHCSHCYAMPVGKEAVCVAFVRPYVCPSVAYIANNSRTQRPSVLKFGMKVPHLWCDSHTSFKVKKVKGQGHQAH